MLRTTFLASSALVASFAISGCSQETPQTQTQQTQERQTSELATQPAPNAAERVAAETANEVEQAAQTNAQFTPAELAASLRVQDVPNPATTLSTASVKTPDGQTLGEVRSVVVGPNGRADVIVVEVGGFLNVGERAVSIEASKFNYLKDRNILVVAVAKSDLEKLPPAVMQ